jgi:hypothetical protein
MRVVETGSAGQTRSVATVRRSLLLLSWVLALTALVVGMRVLGRGTLAGPPLGHPATWSRWATDRGAPDAAMALLRLAVQAVASYLLVATLFGVVVRLVRVRPLLAAADALTVPVVRRVVQAGLGAGLAGAALVPSGIAVAAIPAAPTTSAVPIAPGDDVAPVMQRLDVAVAPAQARTWTVAAGEHLWSISERILSDAWSRPPSDQEIAPFWREVIAENRDRLVDPDNPDLIFPGQVLLVPSPSAPG